MLRFNYSHRVNHIIDKSIEPDIWMGYKTELLRTEMLSKIEINYTVCEE